MCFNLPFSHLFRNWAQRNKHDCTRQGVGLSCTRPKVHLCACPWLQPSTGAAASNNSLGPCSQNQKCKQPEVLPCCPHPSTQTPLSPALVPRAKPTPQPWPITQLLSLQGPQVDMPYLLYTWKCLIALHKFSVGFLLSLIFFPIPGLFIPLILLLNTKYTEVQAYKHPSPEVSIPELIPPLP